MSDSLTAVYAAVAAEDGDAYLEKVIYSSENQSFQKYFSEFSGFLGFHFFPAT